MKKRGARDIPDFSSHKKPGVKAAPGAERKSTHPSQTAARNVKPPATSAKSGRRGQ